MALLRFTRGEAKTKDEVALQDLVGKLLEPSREQRLKNFESKTEREMQMVLKHPFFDAKSLDDATLQTVRDQIKEVGSKLDVVIEMGLEHRIELRRTCQVSAAHLPRTHACCSLLPFVRARCVLLAEFATPLTRCCSGACTRRPRC